MAGSAHADIFLDQNRMPTDHTHALQLLLTDLSYKISKIINSNWKEKKDTELFLVHDPGLHHPVHPLLQFKYYYLLCFLIRKLPRALTQTTPLQLHVY